MKNPEHLTDHQQAGLARVAQVNKTLYRAYLLKEQFRLVFQLGGKAAIRALDDWCAWARRCRIPALVDPYYRVVKHRDSIVATLTNDGLSNALVESTNTKLRLLTRVAYGFRSTDNLIALCLLDRGDYCPPLPGRHCEAGHRAFHRLRRIVLGEAIQQRCALVVGGKERLDGEIG